MKFITFTLRMVGANWARFLTFNRPGWFILGMCLLFTCQARGEISGTDSVEWLTCKSEIVAKGRITVNRKTKGPGDVFFHDCTLEVTEVIKGKPDRRIFFSHRRLSDPAEAMDVTDREVLVFLSRWEDHYTDEEARLWVAQDSKHDARMHGRLVPAWRHGRLSIFEMSSVPLHLFDKEMQPVKDSGRLLELCRAWAKSDTKFAVSENAPFGSEFFNEFNAGSAVYLAVPAEEKHRLKYLAQAGSDVVSDRVAAAGGLGMFPGAESETALRRLLDDQSESIWMYSQDTISEIEYSVRSGAAQSLKLLGKPVPDLVLRRFPDEVEQRNFRHAAWTKNFQAALQGKWKILEIRDGRTRKIDSRDFVVVEMDLSGSSGQGHVWLVPKEFPEGDDIRGEYLGMNGLNSQGARRFYFDKGGDPELRQLLVKYFGLVKP
jgi:hypothetical protein